MEAADQAGFDPEASVFIKQGSEAFATSLETKRVPRARLRQHREIVRMRIYHVGSLAQNGIVLAMTHVRSQVPGCSNQQDVRALTGPSRRAEAKVEAKE